MQHHPSFIVTRGPCSLPLLAACAALSSLCLPANAAVLRVKPGAPGTPDGTTWATAFCSIGAALTAAAPGDSVWAAGGVYPERVVLRAGVSLLGGFAGTETAPERVRPWSHPTIIDAADRNGPVVTIPKEAPNTTVDGFTLTNGTGIASAYQEDVRGGGLHILGDNATITRNIIRGNAVTAYGRNAVATGAGVYAEGVSVTLTNNVIRDNEASVHMDRSVPVWVGGTAEGGGAAFVNAKVSAANNLIAENGVGCSGSFYTARTPGSGLYAYGCAGRIANNTVVANAGNEAQGYGGIYNGALSLERSPSTLTVANNIVAFDSWCGVERREDSALLTHNDVFGNGLEYGGADPTGTNGNISADPRFVDRANGNYHLLPGSPTLDAGDDAAAVGPLDLSGQPRIQGAHVDMGAYELDPVRPHVWRVKANATGMPHDGASWETAFASIAPALEVAAPGDQVWVARGTYTESLRLATDDLGLYGGFAGTETAREARDPKAHVTTIGPSAATWYDKWVTVAGASGFVVDGFTVRDGYTGFYCEAGSAGTISNNVITGNGLGEGNEAGGIYAGRGCSLDIIGNVISQNHCASGGGIAAQDTRLEVARNVISDNLAFIDVGAPVFGGGLFCVGGSAVIHDNLFVGNMADADVAFPHLSAQPEARGGAIAGWNATLTISNNTIVDNTAGLTSRSYNGAAEGGAIYIGRGSATIRNNVIAGNRAAAPTQYNNTLGPGDVAYSDGSQVTFWTNLLFDNVPATSPLPEGNIAGDPLFVDPANGDYHLRPGSPAINAGFDGAIESTIDLDGLPRYVPPKVDLGAYESQTPPPFTISDVGFALRIAAGLSAYNTFLARYDIVKDGDSTGRIDLFDAARLARKVAGVEPNP